MSSHQAVYRLAYQVDVCSCQVQVLVGSCHKAHVLEAGDGLWGRPGAQNAVLAAPEKVQKTNSPQMTVEHTSPVVAEVHA